MSNSNGAQQQSIPQVTTFQFSNEAVGQIKDSVNLFTGTANVPLNIISLPGRKGLDVNVGLMYSSNVQAGVQNWNLTNPTGILGLGWEMPFDKIVVDKAGNGSPSADQFFLLGNGSGNALIQDGFIPATPQNILTFQTRNYEFWDIQYDPANEKWTVTKEDGSVFIYGDKNSGRQTVQYGVGWGNWLGNSSLALGQEQYVKTWNLSEIQNTWGENVTYEYDNVQYKVGDNNGLLYTQASYLKKINDSFGRTIIFQYNEKFGALNPSPQNIIEYQAAHTDKAPPNAYQDQYETRFLAGIDVLNALNEKQFSIVFEYDFINIGVQSQTNVFPLMYKRVLTSFWQVQPQGRTLPGMEFEYYGLYTDVNPGALKAITYPQGARAEYTYKQQPLTTSRNLKVSSPLQGATPRVWFGSDYTVITWYNATTKTLRGTIYSWCGNWVTFELNSDVQERYFDNVDFDINTLGVITRSDFIALYFVERTSKQLRLFLYRRNQQNYGVFNLSSGPRYLPVNSTKPQVRVDAGDSFVIAFGKDFTTTPVTAYEWNWKQKRWDTTPSSNPPQGFIPVQIPSPTDVANATNLVITARNNYYIAAMYNNSSKLLQFQLFYHDGNLVWSKSPLYSTGNVQIYQDPNNPTAFMFGLGLSDAFATATYVNSITATEAAYSIRILQWDKNFNLLNAATPLVNSYKSPVTNGKAQFNIFSTLLTDALIANNPYLNRYTGGPGSSNNPQNWKQASFATSPTDTVLFATGQDVSVLSVQNGTTAANKYLQFNPNTGAWGTAQSLASAGTNPTISANYMTAGQDLFVKNTNGQWIKQGALGNVQSPQTLQNHGPSYIAYQDSMTNTANTWFVPIRNGLTGMPVQLPLTAGGTGQKIFVQQDQVLAGTLLSGADTFVTYPADQSFDTAQALALYKVVNNGATGIVTVTPVSYMEIDDKFYSEANYYQSYDYASSAQSVITFDAATGTAQFPRVTVASGTKNTSGPTPSGVAISYFSNGVSPQSQVPYPSNWVYNFNMLLNGALLQKEDYNNQGQLVQRQTNYWKITQTDAVHQCYLFGAYYRMDKNVVLKDGVTQTVDLLYYQDTGLQQSTTASYYDSSGAVRTVLEENVYAIQVPVYAQAMKQKHFLNAIAQQTASVTDANGAKSYVSSKVSTWKNWSGDGNWKWAAFQSYEWLGPEDGNPVFDFSPNGNRDGWLKKQEIASRALPYNIVAEALNVQGVPSSYIYDNKGRFQVAEFPTASISGDEVSYYSFEPYENAGGWQLGSNAQIIPNTNNTVIDAQMGVSSLLFTSGTGMQRQFTPGNQSKDYVFSSYVKLPDGFDLKKGVAQWTISFSKNGAPVGQPVVLPFGEKVGSWMYVFTIINPGSLNAGGPVTIDIKAQNNNSASAVLVDCVRFSPVQSLFAAIAMDVHTGVANASLGVNGEVQRNFFDAYYRVAATAGFTGNTASIATAYFSRTGNNNQFSADDPNMQLRISAAGGGSALSFTKGNEWQQYWTPGPGSVWASEGGKLKLQSFQTTGQLTSKESGSNKFGVFTNITLAGALTNPLGLQVGSMFTVKWVPALGQWQLIDGAGTVLKEKSPNKFSVKTAAPAGSSALRDEALHLLLRHGFCPDDMQAFTVSGDDGMANVSGIGNQWLLLINNTSLFFYVDGQQVFNYVNATAITGAVTLFAGNSIVLDYLLTCYDNQVTSTFINQTGNDVQSQLLLDDYVNVIQNVYDYQGRIIANTKPAYVPSVKNALFTYFKDFAVYNFANGAISGFVADYYQDDGGYPYFGTKYEASPLGRVIEKSMPGTDYKLGTHTQQMSYGTNGPESGLPAGQYYKTTIIDQNGNLSYSLADKRGQQVRKVSQKSNNEQIVAAAYFDNAGNIIKLQSPNYQQGNDSNWETAMVYDFTGRLITAASNTMGQVQLIYDPANRLRFRQDAQAAADGNYQYYKYDAVGRIIEKGYVTGAWDRKQLQQQANTNPNYPATPLTWSSKIFYDYDGTNQPNQLGRTLKILSAQSATGQADVEETFAYDVIGNVTTSKQKVAAYDNNYYQTGFNYNNAGGITSIDYPVAASGAPLRIFYQYNNAGQITGISDAVDQPGNIASYTYNAAGNPEQEIINPGNANPIVRKYLYDSPTWLKQLQDTGKNNEQLFAELMKTSAVGSSYYNGQPAQISFTYPNGINAGSVFTNKYNGINALVQADETGTASQGRQYSFDNNGNFDTVIIGGQNYKYNKVAGKGDQLQNIQANGVTKIEFNYDQNGYVKTYRDADAPTNVLDFTYDPGIKLTTKINSLTFRYGNNGDRVLKQQLSGSAVTASTQYVNSFACKTLLRISKTNNSSEAVSIIYGPSGMTVMIKDSKRYSLLKDHLGSVRLILDSNAAVAAAYDYDLYGTVRTIQEPSPGFFTYLYSSQELDIETGIYNFKARFYFSKAGRFGVIDNYNQFYSPYLYAGNNPLVYIDPSGNFSIGNFFSALGGAIIGAIEILIGVAIDAIAGILEVITGGLSTPVSVGLAMAGGAFIGAGVSAVSYSAVGLITNDFSWKEYGINTAIGFVAGAITAGFGAAGSLVAEAATGVKAAQAAGEAVSTLSKVANTGIKTGFAVAGAETAATTSTLIGNAARGNDLTTGLGAALITSAVSTTISNVIPSIDYKAGWGNLLTRMAAGIVKSEAIGITIKIGSNAIQGQSLDNGLLNTVVSGIVGGSVRSFGTRDYAKEETKRAANFMNFGPPQAQVPADGIIRLS